MSKTAFIGLGAMGSRIAANLLKAGHELTIFDLDPEAVKKLSCAGAKPATSPREAAKGNEFGFTMVPTIRSLKRSGWTLIKARWREWSLKPLLYRCLR